MNLYQLVHIDKLWSGHLLVVEVFAVEVVDFATLFHTFKSHVKLFAAALNGLGLHVVF
jgi:hypothetical protein